MNTLPESHRRPLFPRGPGLGLRASLLVCVALVMMFYDARTDALHSTRNTLALVTTPLVWLAQLPSTVFSAASSLDTRSSLERENRELREQQLLLSSRLQRLEALEAENRRIRELLASAARIDDDVLIAEIIAINQDPYRSQITLNRGSRDGVYRGQALVDAQGVLGQVIDVTGRRSQALLLTDPDHGIPIEINRTGMQTIAIGAGELGLRLPFLASNADVQVGDLLVSSALGGRFPSGYPVGIVYDVKHVAGEHFMEAYAAPAAKLNQGRQVLLVWNERPGDDADEVSSEPTDRAPDADADNTAATADADAATDPAAEAPTP